MDKISNDYNNEITDTQTQKALEWYVENRLVPMLMGTSASPNNKYFGDCKTFLIDSEKTRKNDE